MENIGMILEEPEGVVVEVVIFCEVTKKCDSIDLQMRFLI